MLSFLKAIGYFLAHPFDTVDLTIVRRYADAQTHFIGELYEGSGRDAKMIGMSCDNLPLNAVTGSYDISYTHSFLDALPAMTIRVGALEPKDNAKIQEYIALRRFCMIRVTIMNRFIEYVLQGNVKL